MRRMRAKTVIACGVALLIAACAQPPERQPVGGAPPETPSAQPVLPGPVLGQPLDQAVSRARTAGGVYPGTGRLVGEAPPRPAAPQIATMPNGDVTLNFVDADLREVIRAILGDMLGANYVVDPAVQGAVTMQTSRPMAPAALLSTLEQILGLNGAALVAADGMYQIVPADRATLGAPGTQLERPSARAALGTATSIVPLQFVAAAEMQKMLEPLAPAGAILNVDPVRNVIVLGGDQMTRANLLDVIQMFDVDWLGGKSFALFPTQSTDLDSLVAELDAIFGDPEQGGGIVRFVPIPRLNAILGISTNREYLRRAGTWVTRLDAGDEEVQRIFVYFVQNARAGELAEILTEIFSPGEVPTVTRPDLAPGLQPIEIGTGQAEADPQQPVRRRTGGGADIRMGAQGPIRIIADTSRNALVVLATPRDYRLVQGAFSRLDIIPLQVLIEATIAEVVLNNDLRYGLEWFFRSGSSTFTLSSALGGAVAPIFPGFNYVLATEDVRVVLNALEEVTDVRVISSPSLAVLDNYTARLVVGDQVPILTRTTQSIDTPDAPIVSSIEYRDTGVQLDVTPRVNAGGLVTLEIDQNVSDVVQTVTSGIDSPTIQQRQILSTVAVQDGQTVALGGLIRDRQGESSRGLPFIARLPVVGFLFGQKGRFADRTELIVFITPRVIRNPAEAARITEELRLRLRDVAPLDVRIR
jgi:general secretion pathway protein D